MRFSQLGTITEDNQSLEDVSVPTDETQTECNQEEKPGPTGTSTKELVNVLHETKIVIEVHDEHDQFPDSYEHSIISLKATEANTPRSIETLIPPQSVELDADEPIEDYFGGSLNEERNQTDDPFSETEDVAKIDFGFE